MLFQMIDFTVAKQDFGTVNITLKNNLGQSFPFKVYILSEPIKLVPTSKIPSFYMVNKYGEVYNTTQYFLVPYIRFMIADPSIVYTENKTNYDGFGETSRTDYRQNPFHGYWIGGTSFTGNGTNNVNQYAFENMKKIMDLYLMPPGNLTRSTTHGIQNENSFVSILKGIGEDLVPNEGSLKEGMFVPANAQYLQAGVDGSSTFENYNHRLAFVLGVGPNNLFAKYNYKMLLPEVSDNPAMPFMLPPLFTNLMSWYSLNAVSTSGCFDRAVDNLNAISVLTFGVQRA